MFKKLILLLVVPIIFMMTGCNEDGNSSSASTYSGTVDSDDGNLGDSGGNRDGSHSTAPSDGPEDSGEPVSFLKLEYDVSTKDPIIIHINKMPSVAQVVGVSNIVIKCDVGVTGKLYISKDQKLHFQADFNQDDEGSTCIAKALIKTKYGDEEKDIGASLKFYINPSTTAFDIEDRAITVVEETVVKVTSPETNFKILKVETELPSSKKGCENLLFDTDNLKYYIVGDAFTGECRDTITVTGIADGKVETVRDMIMVVWKAPYARFDAPKDVEVKYGEDAQVKLINLINTDKIEASDFTIVKTNQPNECAAGVKAKIENGIPFIYLDESAKAETCEIKVKVTANTGKYTAKEREFKINLIKTAFFDFEINKDIEVAPSIVLPLLNTKNDIDNTLTAVKATPNNNTCSNVAVTIDNGKVKFALKKNEVTVPSCTMDLEIEAKKEGNYVNKTKTFPLKLTLLPVIDGDALGGTKVDVLLVPNSVKKITLPNDVKIEKINSLPSEIDVDSLEDINHEYASADKAIEFKLSNGKTKARKGKRAYFNLKLAKDGYKTTDLDIEFSFTVEPFFNIELDKDTLSIAEGATETVKVTNADSSVIDKVEAVGNDCKNILFNNVIYIIGANSIQFTLKAGLTEPKTCTVNFDVRAKKSSYNETFETKTVTLNFVPKIKIELAETEVTVDQNKSRVVELKDNTITLSKAAINTSKSDCTDVNVKLNANKKVELSLANGAVPGVCNLYVDLSGSKSGFTENNETVYLKVNKVTLSTFAFKESEIELTKEYVALDINPADVVLSNAEMIKDDCSKDVGFSFEDKQIKISYNGSLPDSCTINFKVTGKQPNLLENTLLLPIKVVKKPSFKANFVNPNVVLTPLKSEYLELDDPNITIINYNISGSCTDKFAYLLDNKKIKLTLKSNFSEHDSCDLDVTIVGKKDNYVNSTFTAKANLKTKPYFNVELENSYLLLKQNQSKSIALKGGAKASSIAELSFDDAKTCENVNITIDNGAIKVSLGETKKVESCKVTMKVIADKDNYTQSLSKELYMTIDKLLSFDFILDKDEVTLNESSSEYISVKDPSGVTLNSNFKSSGCNGEVISSIENNRLKLKLKIGAKSESCNLSVSLKASKANYEDSAKDFVIKINKEPRPFPKGDLSASPVKAYETKRSVIELKSSSATNLNVSSAKLALDNNCEKLKITHSGGKAYLQLEPGATPSTCTAKINVEIDNGGYEKVSEDVNVSVTRVPLVNFDLTPTAIDIQGHEIKTLTVTKDIVIEKLISSSGCAGVEVKLVGNKLDVSLLSTADDKPCKLSVTLEGSKANYENNEKTFNIDVTKRPPFDYTLDKYKFAVTPKVSDFASIKEPGVTLQSAELAQNACADVTAVEKNGVIEFTMAGNGKTNICENVDLIVYAVKSNTASIRKEFKVTIDKTGYSIIKDYTTKDMVLTPTESKHIVFNDPEVKLHSSSIAAVNSCKGIKINADNTLSLATNATAETCALVLNAQLFKNKDLTVTEQITVNIIKKPYPSIEFVNTTVKLKPSLTHTLPLKDSALKVSDAVITSRNASCNGVEIKAEGGLVKAVLGSTLQPEDCVLKVKVTANKADYTELSKELDLTIQKYKTFAFTITPTVVTINDGKTESVSFVEAGVTASSVKVADTSECKDVTTLATGSSIILGLAANANPGECKLVLDITAEKEGSLPSSDKKTINVTKILKFDLDLVKKDFVVTPISNEAISITDTIASYTVEKVSGCDDVLIDKYSLKLSSGAAKGTCKMEIKVTAEKPYHQKQVKNFTVNIIKKPYPSIEFVNTTVKLKPSLTHTLPLKDSALKVSDAVITSRNASCNGVEIKAEGGLVKAVLGSTLQPEDCVLKVKVTANKADYTELSKELDLTIQKYKTFAFTITPTVVTINDGKTESVSFVEAGVTASSVKVADTSECKDVTTLATGSSIILGLAANANPGECKLVLDITAEKEGSLPSSDKKTINVTKILKFDLDLVKKDFVVTPISNEAISITDTIASYTVEKVSGCDDVLIDKYSLKLSSGAAKGTCKMEIKVTAEKPYHQKQVKNFTVNITKKPYPSIEFVNTTVKLKPSLTHTLPLKDSALKVSDAVITSRNASCNGVEIKAEGGLVKAVLGSTLQPEDCVLKVKVTANKADYTELSKELDLTIQKYKTFAFTITPTVVTINDGKTESVSFVEAGVTASSVKVADTSECKDVTTLATGSSIILGLAANANPGECKLVLDITAEKEGSLPSSDKKTINVTKILKFDLDLVKKDFVVTPISNEAISITDTIASYTVEKVSGCDDVLIDKYSLKLSSGAAKGTCKMEIKVTAEKPYHQKQVKNFTVNITKKPYFDFDRLDSMIKVESKSQVRLNDSAVFAKSAKFASTTCGNDISVTIENGKIYLVAGKGMVAGTCSVKILVEASKEGYSDVAKTLSDIVVVKDPTDVIEPIGDTELGYLSTIYGPHCHGNCGLHKRNHSNCYGYGKVGGGIGKGSGKGHMHRYGASIRCSDNKCNGKHLCCNSKCNAEPYYKYSTILSFENKGGYTLSFVPNSLKGNSCVRVDTSILNQNKLFIYAEREDRNPATLPQDLIPCKGGNEISFDLIASKPGEASKRQTFTYTIKGVAQGTPSDPYVIFDEESLSLVLAYKYNAMYNYKLVDDVVVMSPWKHKFLKDLDAKAVIDGNFKTIMLVNGFDSRTNGLFAQLSGTVRDLNITYLGNYSEMPNYSGVLAGKATNAVIDNVHVKILKDFRGIAYLGGLVGQANKNTFISGSSVSGKVIGKSYKVGGLVGFVLDPSVYITNSYSSGSVESTHNFVGGLVGKLYKGNILNSYSIADVKGLNFVGGLTGKVYNGTVKDSYAMGNVYGYTYVGGLSGRACGGNIYNSYATGTVFGTTYTYVGGFVGGAASSKISNNIALNDVVATAGKYSTNMGRVFGYYVLKDTNYAISTLALKVNTNNGLGGFYVSPSNHIKEGVAIAPQQLVKDFYQRQMGLNFVNTWRMLLDDYATNNRPVLKWQKIVPVSYSYPGSSDISIVNTNVKVPSHVSSITVNFSPTDWYYELKVGDEVITYTGYEAKFDAYGNAKFTVDAYLNDVKIESVDFNFKAAGY